MAEARKGRGQEREEGEKECGDAFAFPLSFQSVRTVLPTLRASLSSANSGNHPPRHTYRCPTPVPKVYLTPVRLTSRIIANLYTNIYSFKCTRIREPSRVESYFWPSVNWFK